MDSAVSAHQRKIELQSPEDLAFLLANVRRAAAARIDEAFPPVEGAHGEDELRTRIEQLINEVWRNSPEIILFQSRILIHCISPCAVLATSSGLLKLTRPLGINCSTSKRPSSSPRQTSP